VSALTSPECPTRLFTIQEAAEALRIPISWAVRANPTECNPVQKNRQIRSFHEGEAHWLFLLQPFAPGVEGVFRQPLVLAELLHGHSAALLRRDSFGPLVGFGSGRLTLNRAVGHDTTMQRVAAGWEEGSSAAYSRNSLEPCPPARLSGGQNLFLEVLENNGGRAQTRTVDLLRVKNSGSFYYFYLLLGFSTTWGVCFRSADNL
jgi:hypothetical protein